MSPTLSEVFLLPEPEINDRDFAQVVGLCFLRDSTEIGHRVFTQACETAGRLFAPRGAQPLDCSEPQGVRGFSLKGRSVRALPVDGNPGLTLELRIEDQAGRVGSVLVLRR